MHSARPYLAAFRARFQLMLQYRAAALAGFATQVWWGGIRIMVFAAFYGVHAAAAPISLADAVTYVWLGQGLLALLPWVADPEIGQAVRTGGVGYDRLRPLDAYGYWYARTLGWMLARALPVATAANVADSEVLPDLLHGEETCVWGDQAYRGQTAVIKEHAPDARDLTNRRYRHRGVVDEEERRKNRTKSKVRSRVEHVIGIIKRVFGFAKVRYRGLDKNAHRLFVTCARANLFTARHYLLHQPA